MRADSWQPFVMGWKGASTPIFKCEITRYEEAWFLATVGKALYDYVWKLSHTFSMGNSQLHLYAEQGGRHTTVYQMQLWKPRWIHIPPTCAFTVCKNATSKVVIYTGNLKCWRHSAKQGETTTLIIPRNLSLKMKLSSNGGTPSSSWSFLVTGREG